LIATQQPFLEMRMLRNCTDTHHSGHALRSRLEVEKIGSDPLVELLRKFRQAIFVGIGTSTQSPPVLAALLWRRRCIPSSVDGYHTTDEATGCTLPPSHHSSNNFRSIVDFEDTNELISS